MLLLDETAQDEALSRLNLTDLWGIAGRLAAKLNLLGVKMTPCSISSAPILLFLRDRLGVVTLRMAMELRGVACLDLERSAPDRKSIMASRSFGRAITTLPEMEEAVASYTARAAEKLRRQRSGDGAYRHGLHRDQPLQARTKSSTIAARPVHLRGRDIRHRQAHQGGAVMPARELA